MNWREEPASESQLEYLKVFGFTPDRPITKGEASELLTQFKEDPERQRIRAEARVAERARKDAQNRMDQAEREVDMAYYLHADCDSAKKSLAEAERGEAQEAKVYLRELQEDRFRFWQETFRAPAWERTDLQPIKLYLEHGHRFNLPAKNILQAMLDTLDADSATWDRDNPGYFFQTLEYNFPQLLRKRIDYEELKSVLRSYEDFAKLKLKMWQLDGTQ
jgi:hypothetical protein